MKFFAKKLPAIMIFAVSIALIYERQLRSFGSIELPPPTSFLVSGLWLKDLGLLAPVILWMLTFGRIDRGTRYIVFAYLLTLLYGAILFVAYSNSNAEVGEDLRTFLSLFTGLAIVSNLRMPMHQLIRLLNCLLLALVVFAFVQLISVPQAPLWLTQRVTSLALYEVTGIPVLLLPTAFVLSRIFGRRTDQRLAWIVYVCLLILFIVLAKTRSAAIVVLVGLPLGMLAIAKLGNVMSDARGKSPNRLWYVFALLAIPIVLFSAGEAVQGFIERVESSANVTEDYTTAVRVLEVATVYSATSDMKLLVGSGIGPPHLLLSDADVSQSHNSMHFGSLNILWRFGVVAFTFWLFGLIKVLWRFVNAEKELRNSYPGAKSGIVALICCAPSLMVYAIGASTSGGFGVISFLCLGMLLGLYREVRKAPQFAMSRIRGRVPQLRA